MLVYIFLILRVRRSVKLRNPIAHYVSMTHWELGSSGTSPSACVFIFIALFSVVRTQPLLVPVFFAFVCGYANISIILACITKLMISWIELSWYKRYYFNFRGVCLFLLLCFVCAKDLIKRNHISTRSCVQLSKHGELLNCWICNFFALVIVNKLVDRVPVCFHHSSPSVISSSKR